jgi:hypothetical protein
LTCLVSVCYTSGLAGRNACPGPADGFSTAQAD